MTFGAPRPNVITAPASLSATHTHTCTDTGHTRAQTGRDCESAIQLLSTRIYVDYYPRNDKAVVLNDKHYISEESHLHCGSCSYVCNASGVKKNRAVLFTALLQICEHRCLWTFPLNLFFFVFLLLSCKYRREITWSIYTEKLIHCSWRYYWQILIIRTSIYWYMF